ncbi:hypothetical protein BGZ83_003468 [Gryganskiella cystojenkinii]|nr:hypothetical protein BGZ83_003468 [Gryganskiella cystojenkinii]
MSDSQFCYAHWSDVDLLCAIDDPDAEPFPAEFQLLDNFPAEAYKLTPSKKQQPEEHDDDDEGKQEIPGKEQDWKDANTTEERGSTMG